MSNRVIFQDGSTGKGVQALATANPPLTPPRRGTGGELEL